MTALLLAPHADDETLFAFYQVLRLKPIVCVCLDDGVERLHELEAAMKVADCSWLRLNVPEQAPDWGQVRKAVALEARKATTLIAPAYEDGGHEHHNQVARIADSFGHPCVIRYLTYRRGFGRSEGGIKIAPSLEERELKARALNCYVSQRQDERTSAWFPPGAYGTLDEWIIRA